MNGPSLYDEPGEFYRPAREWGRFTWLLDLIVVTIALVLLAAFHIVDTGRWMIRKVRGG